jgi:hypothetical protein
MLGLGQLAPISVNDTLALQFGIVFDATNAKPTFWPIVFPLAFAVFGTVGLRWPGSTRGEEST